jgi:hypothetical protein
MDMEPLLAVRDEILGVIDSNDIKGDLQREIARIIAPFDDGKTAGSLRRDIVDLIGFIEEAKVRFLRGELRAKNFYRDVTFGLRQFEMRYQGLDCRENRVFNAYYSACANRE